MILSLDTYDNGPLTAGWTCSHCGAELAPGDQHVHNPAMPDLAFCSARCAIDHAAGLRRPSSVDPRQRALLIT